VVVSKTAAERKAEVSEALDKVNDMARRVERCSLSDTGNWTNQNVVFTKSLRDMFPLAQAILAGAIARDECRGAHYKPEFAMPGLEATDPAEQRRTAERWCDRFEANTARWLKTTIATLDADGQVELSYEEVDASLTPPRPRLYGLAGAEIIEEVWKSRAAGRPPGAAGNASDPQKPSAARPATVR